ncbi:MAG: type II toxin-antitoxin system RelE/ParE family toxin [bacterium]
MYKLVYTKTAVNDLAKIDIVAKKRIKKKIEEHSTSPFNHAKKLTHPRLGDYRWRIGNYRIVFDVKGKDIVILRIGHRREIYRK